MVKPLVKGPITAKNSTHLEHFGRGLRVDAEVEPGVLSVPDRGEGGRVLGGLLLEVDDRGVLLELDRSVATLLGIEVELQNPTNRWAI